MKKMKIKDIKREGMASVRILRSDLKQVHCYLAIDDITGAFAWIEIVKKRVDKLYENLETHRINLTE